MSIHLSNNISIFIECEIERIIRMKYSEILNLDVIDYQTNQFFTTKCEMCKGEGYIFDNDIEDFLEECVQEDLIEVYDSIFHCYNCGGTGYTNWLTPIFLRKRLSFRAKLIFVDERIRNITDAIVVVED